MRITGLFYLIDLTRMIFPVSNRFAIFAVRAILEEPKDLLDIFARKEDLRVDDCPSVRRRRTKAAAELADLPQGRSDGLHHTYLYSYYALPAGARVTLAELIEDRAARDGGADAYDVCLPGSCGCAIADWERQTWERAHIPDEPPSRCSRFH